MGNGDDGEVDPYGLKESWSPDPCRDDELVSFKDALLCDQGYLPVSTSRDSTGFRRDNNTTQ
jgi:hypothetical protein